MFRSWVPLTVALATLTAMIWLDWKFPTPVFYAPANSSGAAVSNLLLFKKTIEMSLSVLLLSMVVLVVLWKRSVIAEKYLAYLALGAGLGFWLHRDLFYLLLH